MGHILPDKLLPRGVWGGCVFLLQKCDEFQCRLDFFRGRSASERPSVHGADMLDRFTFYRQELP